LETKKLKELYCVDTISQDKGWKKVQEALGGLQDDIMIDFENINVVDPWQCIEFKQLLRNEHVFMRFINNDSIVNRIKMMCIIDGLDESRIINVTKEVPKEKTPEEKKVERYGSGLIPYFEMGEDGVATLDLAKKYDQIQSSSTMDYVDFAIREIHKDNGIKSFVLRVGSLVILENVLQAIAHMMVEYNSEGFEMLVDCDDEETRKKLGLFIHITTNNKYNELERKKAIQNNLRRGTAGMLIKYKKSKALDDFGRQGKGEVVSSRIAIFRSIKADQKTGHPMAVIESYNNNYFYTPQHWMIEHDGEEPTKLHMDTLEIPLDEIGFCDMFLGSKYHFILPIQHDEAENQVVIKDFDEEGRNIKVKCTIPERMKLVFDAWHVDYDGQALDEAIKTTKDYLEKKKNGSLDKLEGISNT
jgi:hypothetical protein